MSEFTILEARNRALQHYQAGRLAEAESLFRQILAVSPNQPEALHLLGLIALNTQRFAEGENYLRRAVALAPNQPDILFNLGHFLIETNRHAQAVELLQGALKLDPNLVDAWFDLGRALDALGQTAAAADVYQNASRLRPNDPRILNYLGNVLRTLGRVADAEQCLRHAVELQPNIAESHGNLGALYESQGRFAEALHHAQQALAIAPNHPVLHFNMGVALAGLDRLAEAIACFQKTLQSQPDNFAAYNNLANAFTRRGSFNEAIDAYRHAIRLHPNYGVTLRNLAATCQKVGRHEEAVSLFRRALALSPEDFVLHSNLIFALLFSPQADAQAIREELALWNDRHARPLLSSSQPHFNDRNPDRRLRIGFVSPSFRDHVIARNMLPIFQNRDRASFEFFCYSNLASPDAMTESFRQLTDHWSDVHTLTDEQLAARIRADQIDILVDLALHMGGHSLRTFARKPAPVQVTFAGYPGSTGLTAIDYRLSDPYLDPPETDSHYAEKTFRLPHSFWCYDPLGETAVPNTLPAAATVPPGIITFGNLNYLMKYNEFTFELWSHILRQVPNSRLLLLSPEGTHRQDTLNFFQTRGIAPDRIEFSTFQHRPAYLQLYHKIDIVLDTLPYNGHTTSLDALWMSVPVVTLVGKTVAGRAGYSQLMNLNLPELITHTPQQFIDTTTALANDLPRLQNLRATIRQRMEQSPLMDAPTFTRDIEAAFRAMWTAWCSRP